ncbi:unnamed protein product [Phytophthora lilii]|uniref:RxLR effector protein n=1 Tax=Phytophthora lilii TaxID=2077276 RepID=A0A9W6TYU2_9STRA|nr:unnamed protein product [Phytophthora lilii]
MKTDMNNVMLPPRFLRSHQSVHDEDDVEDEDKYEDAEDRDNISAEDEERAGGTNLFKTWKLDQMLASIKTFKRFKRMKAAGYNPSKLEDELRDIAGNKYRSLWEMYHANYYTI